MKFFPLIRGTGSSLGALRGGNEHRAMIAVSNLIRDEINLNSDRIGMNISIKQFPRLGPVSPGCAIFHLIMNIRLFRLN